METSEDLKRWSVMMNELSQGRELAKQLQNHLDPSSPQETREYLIEKILSTYNKLLHMTNLDSIQVDPNSLIAFNGECPSSIYPSSDLQNIHRASKKRKTWPKRVETVKVSTQEGGAEGNVNDGYSWRKYGQKTILGATFPRGYYRCSHRSSRNCYATKQVQKSTEDPTLLQLVYKGHHTCGQPSASKNPPPVHHGSVRVLKPDSQPVKLQQTPQPQLMVKIEEPDTLDFDKILEEFLETAGETPASQWFVSGSPATSDSNQLPGCNAIWTPESDVIEHFGSGPDSPFGTLEFTFDEFGVIDPFFSFDDPKFF
uniref:WRKY transcription factor n=1 Tax=Fagopyrum tataricum TaxID=62330 RepID=A0A4V1I1W1_FAGTA|nr:WRKY transcription factor [Fagopyrum tataricum]